MRCSRIIIFFILIFCTVCCSPKQEKKKIEVSLAGDTETRDFINFWKEFSFKFNSLDIASVKKLSLDSIWLWGDHVSSNDFIKRYSDGYAKSGLSRIILDTNQTSYRTIDCLSNLPVKETIKQENSIFFYCREAIIRDTLGSVVEVLQFTFLETSVEYKLYKIRNYTYPLSR